MALGEKEDDEMRKYIPPVGFNWQRFDYSRAMVLHDCPHCGVKKGYYCKTLKGKICFTPHVKRCAKVNMEHCMIEIHNEQIEEMKEKEK